VQEDIPYHIEKGMVGQFKNGMVYPPATSKAGARQLEQFKEASSKPAQL
jgi:hypothetical protein